MLVAGDILGRMERKIKQEVTGDDPIGSGSSHVPPCNITGYKLEPVDDVKVDPALEGIIKADKDTDVASHVPVDDVKVDPALEGIIKADKDTDVASHVHVPSLKREGHEGWPVGMVQDSHKLEVNDHGQTSAKAQAAAKAQEAAKQKMKIYRCEECGMGFIHHRDLVRHWKRQHMFACKVCEKEFTSDTDLRLHERNHHNKKSEDRYRCDDCGIIFGGEAELLEHWEKHVFVCPFCDKTCTSFESLREHEKSHAAVPPTSNSLECDVCGQVFQKRANLTVHKRKHERWKNFQLSSLSLPVEKPVTKTVHEKHCCSDCGVTFKARSDFLKHVKTLECKHPKANGNLTGHEMPFSSDMSWLCEKCGAVFTEKCELGKHAKTHDVLMSYSSSMSCLCEKCGAVFTEQSELEKHRETHEGIGEVSKKEVCLTEKCLQRDTVIDAVSKLNNGEVPGQTSDCVRASTKELSYSVVPKDLEKVFAAVSKLENGDVPKQTETVECERASTKELSYSVVPKNLETVIAAVSKLKNGDVVEQTKTMESKRASTKELSHSVIAKNIEQRDRLQEAVERYECKDCNKVFSRKGDLTKHSNRHTVPCKQCSRTFTSVKELAVHEATHAPPQFECKPCGIQFDFESELQAHYTKHIYLCESCDETFTSEKCLRSHEKTHMEVNGVFPCKICHVEYSRQCDLTKHMRKHELSTSSKSVRASSDKISKDTTVLEDDARPYVCEHCDKTFSRQGDLTKHSKKHELPTSSEHVLASSDKIHREAIVLEDVAEPYACKNCDKTFSRPGDLTKHAKRHEISSLRKSDSCSADKLINDGMVDEDVDLECTYCDQVFTRKCDLARHINKHELPIFNKPASPSVYEDVDESFPCKYCDMTFDRRCDLTKHVQKHELLLSGKYMISTDLHVKDIRREDVAQSFPCRHCDKTFSRKCDLANHAKVHSLDEDDQSLITLRAEKLECQECDILFANQWDLDRHWQKHVFACETCPRTFTTKKRLEEHEQEHAVNVERFHCQQCNKFFSRKSDYSRHCNKHTLPCTQCSKTFIKAKDLEEHEATHIVEEKFECEECGMQFTHKPDLIKHQDKHIFMCKVCTKFFTTNQSLQEHKQVHHNGKRFKCELCDKTFQKKSRFLFHKQKHRRTGSTSTNKAHQSRDMKRPVELHSISPESRSSQVVSEKLEKVQQIKEPYHCEHCNKKFGRKCDLSRHLNAHTFTCELCGENFPSSQSLDDHRECHTLLTDMFEDGALGETADETADEQPALPADEEMDTEEDPFQCRFCEKTFTTLRSLHKHEKSHSPEKIETGSSVRMNSRTLNSRHSSSTEEYPGEEDSVEEDLVEDDPADDPTDHSTEDDPGQEEPANPTEEDPAQEEPDIILISDTESDAEDQDDAVTQISSKSEKSESGKFRCGECNETFLWKNSLIRHMDRHANENGYVCDICGQTYSTRHTMMRHKRTMHARLFSHRCKRCGKGFHSKEEVDNHTWLHFKGRFFCRECKREFKTRDLLKKHKETHHRREYVCDKCDKVLHTERGFQKHRAIHDGPRPFACGVKNCNVSFRKKEHLEEHAQKHSANPQYPCKKCGKIFGKREVRNKHLLIHNKRKGEPLVCQHCNKSFKFDVNLKLHIKHYHEGHRPKHKCPECGVLFISKYELANHRRIHSNEKPFACKFCKKCFTHSASLRVHERNHTGERPYVCKHCQQTFKQLSHLKTHMLLHEQKKPYACPHCGKTFRQSTHLDTHVRTHTGVRPYVCKTCGLSFVTKGALKTHDSLHTGDRPYKCRYCPKTFAQPTARRKHEEVHDRPSSHTHQCPKCGEVYGNQASLCIHFRTKCKGTKTRQRDDGSLECLTCGKSFQWLKDLRRHRKSHKAT